MIPPYEIARAKLLSEAKQIVSYGIKQGWLSYPIGTELDANGTPINVVEPDYEVTSSGHSPELCRKAYYLRDRGLTLEDVAKACGVPRGSVYYIISQGHEMFLEEERNRLSVTSPAVLNTNTQGISYPPSINR